MRIGFVYDLRDDYRRLGFSEEEVAEFDTIETVQEIALALARAGGRTDEIGNGRALAERLVRGERWDLVFSIAEGVRGRAREAQVPALCELFDQPYAFSDPLTMGATLDKAVAKRLARDQGIATARFQVFETPDDVRRLRLAYPVFVKPIAEGTGKGCSNASRASSIRELRTATADLVARFRQPVIVEPYLPGREFTVGIVGNGSSAEVIGVMEIVLEAGAEDGVYSLRNKEECETLVSYRLATDDEAMKAAERALAAYRALGCRDVGRLDFRSDATGEPQFLEANPLAGRHPSHSDLPIVTTLSGRSYDWLIESILDAALARYGRQRREASRSEAA